MWLNRRRKKRDFLKNPQALYAHYAQKSHVAENFRTVRTNMQFVSMRENMRVIMVTSPHEGEGKTTMVSNLAVVHAQQGKKVLLIDADLRKPSINNIFQIAHSRGLTLVLSGRLTIEEAVHVSPIPGLDLLTSGPIPPNPLELLSEGSMKTLLDRALQHYDVVFVDTPPTLTVSDAQVLADFCEGSILVIKCGETLKEAAVKAKEKLIHRKARLLGVLLNEKKKRESKAEYYGT